jgi:hypothetical protein
VTLDHRRTSSQRKNERSEFSEENSRSPVNRQISRRSMGDTVSIPERF